MTTFRDLEALLEHVTHEQDILDDNDYLTSTPRGVFDMRVFAEWLKAFHGHSASDALHTLRIHCADRVEPLGPHFFRYRRGWWARLKWRLSSDKCVHCAFRVRVIGGLLASHRESAYCRVCETEYGFPRTDWTGEKGWVPWRD